MEFMGKILLDSRIEDQQKRGLAPPHPTLHLSLVVLFLIIKIIRIRFNLKKI
jgi:hypothetical protein